MGGAAAWLLVVAAFGTAAGSVPDEQDLGRCWYGQDPALQVRHCTDLLANPGLAAGDRPATLRARALARLRRGEAAAALADFDAALQAAPADADARLGRAVALNQAGDPAAALEAAAAALAARPGWPEAHNVRAVALRALGRYAEAVAALDAVLAAQPGHVAARLNRAELRRLLGEDAAAVEDYTVLLRQRPGMWEAYAGRGGAWRRLGEGERALADLGAALEINPRSAATLQDRALAAFYLGRYKAAAQDFTRAARLEPDVYRVIWSYVARRRAGVDARAALHREGDALAARGFAALLLGAFRDEAGEQALAQAATGAHACEGWFYLAQARMARGVAATDLLSAARQACTPAELEGEAAAAELAAAGH